MEESESARVRRMRNSYEPNSLVEWMNSDKWTKVPGFMHVRGDATVRYLKPDARISRIVANGAISGEITCR